MSEAQEQLHNEGGEKQPAGSKFNEFVTAARPYLWWPLAALWIAALAGMGLLRFDTLAVTEAGAQALLLNWSVAEKIVNPIVTMGAPDFRAILFAPLGLYWPGNMVAVKLFTAFLLFAAVTLLYRRLQASTSQEAALLGSALLLVAPITILQVNSLDAGPFLLLCFVLGLWADSRYRAKGKQLGGWYFLQLFLVMVAVSIHPVGIGYPAALAWEWLRKRDDARQRKQFLWGVGLATAFVIALRFGWYGLIWLQNPLASLDALLIAQVPDEVGEPSLWAGSIAVIALVLLLLSSARRVIVDDLFGRMLLIGIVAGLVAADFAWAFVAFAMLCYYGSAQIIAANARLSGAGFTAQRGIVVACFLITSTALMLADKTYHNVIQAQTVSPVDRILRTLADELAESEEPINISSEWPARTMLATRHAAFPLPPVPADEAQFLPSIKGISFLIFDHSNARNKALSMVLARNTDVYETTILEDRAVMITVRRTEAAGAAPATEAPERPASQSTPQAP